MTSGGTGVAPPEDGGPDEHGGPDEEGVPDEGIAGAREAGVARPAGVRGAPAGAGRRGNRAHSRAGSGNLAAATPPRSLGRRLLPWAGLLAFALVVATVLRLFFFQTFFVPSSSMEPTLMVGDRMVVLKFDLGTIHRGEIVVFRRPPGDAQDTTNEDLVKRVIGLPGQTIYSRGNTVYIDGKPIAEPFLPKGEPLGQPIPYMKIPRNDYFVMGDNRLVSYDSRYWHPHFVPRSYIIGEVVLVIWRNGHPYFKAF